jgi:crossover junction endodeoxyribonuclease RusA
MTEEQLAERELRLKAQKKQKEFMPTVHTELLKFNPLAEKLAKAHSVGDKPKQFTKRKEPTMEDVMRAEANRLGLFKNNCSFILPYPPTVNNYFTVARGRKILSKRGRQYRKDVLAAIGPRMPLLTRLTVTVDLCPPDKRRRDLDNVTKAVFDALQHAGVYQDDSQIDFFSVQRGKLTWGGACYVSVKEI